MSDVTQIEENKRTWITELNALVIAAMILLTVLGVDIKITAAIAGLSVPSINILVRILNKKGQSK